MKIPFLICTDMESLLETIDTFHNNPEKSSTTKINKHAASGYSLFTHCLLDVTKNKHDYYRGKDCMKSFCKDFKVHATKIISYKRKEIIPLTIEEINHIASKKLVIYAKKNLVLIIMIKNTTKSKIIVITLENIEALLIMFVK